MIEMTIYKEPRGDAYEALLRALLPFSRRFSLTVQADMGVECSEGCVALLARLSALGAEQVQRSDWPGTALGSRTAAVWTCDISEESLDELLVVDGLYEWIMPDYPEDLAFYRQNGSVVLGSIAHEQEGFLELSKEELEALARSWPLSMYTQRR